MSETYIWLSVEDVKKAAYILSEEISAQLALDGAGINSIGTKSESLEDYFLKITGEGGK